MVSGYDFPTNPLTGLNESVSTVLLFPEIVLQMYKSIFRLWDDVGFNTFRISGFKHHDENRLVVKGPTNMVVVIFLIARYRI